MSSEIRIVTSPWRYRNKWLCLQIKHERHFIVFSNFIQHRSQRIQNLTTQISRRRTFLNFFIVDFDWPTDLWSYMSVRLFITRYYSWTIARMKCITTTLSRRRTNIQIFKFIIIVVNTSSSHKVSYSSSKVMLDEKSDCEWISWGHVGTIEYVRLVPAWTRREKDMARNTLHHTESD
jgi:hypothetical protein